MSPKTDTEVIIGGKVFTLSGYESEDYMQKIASYINGKITEYGKLDGFRRQPLDKQNILLQLNIADDYFKAKKQISILEEELQGKEKELYDLKHELISAQIKLMLYIWVAAVSGPELMRKIFRKKNWLPVSGMLIFFSEKYI